MNIKVVAIERDDSVEKTVYGSSGIMIDDKYVLCTSNILLPIFNDHFLEHWQSVAPGKLHFISHMKNIPEVRIICNNKTGYAKYKVKKGKVYAFFICQDLKSTIGNAFQGWAVDKLENSRDLQIVLSLFVVIRVVPTADINIFKDLLTRWWDLIKNETLLQSDEIIIKSVPFGNKFFLNSFSKGIISNIVGENSSLIISDCPSTPGSEGSPVFKVNSESEVPVGIIISSSCWWRGEWTGLTLIVDIHSILLELLENYYYKLKLKNISHQLIARVESSLLHVYCGSKRGTAIIIDAKTGILLTNSHVISDDHGIEVFWRGQNDSATLLYRTPDNEVYDIAVLKCNPKFLQSINLRSIPTAKESAKVGDEVISVGFAIFSKGVSHSPTVSKGFVAQYSQSMLITTCCVNSGMSGGAVLNKKGELVGIIVCNTKVQDAVYPHLNMAIPYAAIERTIRLFLKNKDSTVLRDLLTDNSKFVSAWKYLEAKL